MTERVRIIHPHDLFKGKIGHVIETIDQHSLCTYVVTFKGYKDKLAYQRSDFKFLKTLYRKSLNPVAIADELIKQLSE